MKERIFTTKEQGRVLIEAGLPISTASGFRDKYLDQLHSMEDNAGRIGLIEAVTPDVSNPVWDVGTLLNLFPHEIKDYTFECYKLRHTWFVSYSDVDDIPIYWSSERLLIDTLFSLMTTLLKNGLYEYKTSNKNLLDTISSRETYRSAEHRMYAQMNKLTEAGAMISLAIELLTSNIRHSYGEINFERHPRPVEVEGEDKH